MRCISRARTCHSRGRMTGWFRFRWRCSSNLMRSYRSSRFGWMMTFNLLARTKQLFSSEDISSRKDIGSAEVEWTYKASGRLRPCVAMISAMQTVADRETPTRQWTNVIMPFFLPCSDNLGFPSILVFSESNSSGEKTYLWNRVLAQSGRRVNRVHYPRRLERASCYESPIHQSHAEARKQVPRHLVSWWFPLPSAALVDSHVWDCQDTYKG